MKMPDVDLAVFMAQCQERLERSFDQWLPPARTHPATLHEAMRYTVMGGGKRIRPTLVYAGGQATGADSQQLDRPACAVELIHAYSLIHDDLPAMDDDDLRRGQASCHRRFDEATAILVGDALQVLAFKILASDPAMIDSDERRREAAGQPSNRFLHGITRLQLACLPAVLGYSVDFTVSAPCAGRCAQPTECAFRRRRKSSAESLLRRFST